MMIAPVVGHAVTAHRCEALVVWRLTASWPRDMIALCRRVVQVWRWWRNCEGLARRVQLAFEVRALAPTHLYRSPYASLCQEQADNPAANRIGPKRNSLSTGRNRTISPHRRHLLRHLWHYSIQTTNTADMSTTTTQTVTATMEPAQPSNAQEILRLFPEINTSLASQTQSSAASDPTLSGYDEEQIRLMDEVCIVLDDNDTPIGSGTKKLCHLMENINKGLLHRAFSVFLFDSQNRLLLQQRASEKITFPDMWTNTCCSHPLGIPGETGATLETAVMGVKRAAQRKLKQELGIQAAQVPIEKFDFLTRIHYKAPSDGKWGEHEIDYILFIKADVDLEVNPNEVRDTKYVSVDELKTMLKNDKLLFTPWFKLICQSMIFEWWEHLNSGLEKYKGNKEIKRML